VLGLYRANGPKFVFCPNELKFDTHVDQLYRNGLEEKIWLEILISWRIKEVTYISLIFYQPTFANLLSGFKWKAKALN
jgi:hypothetical protein